MLPMHTLLCVQHNNASSKTVSDADLELKVVLQKLIEETLS
jgi:hypothetical protein